MHQLLAINRRRMSLLSFWSQLFVGRCFGVQSSSNMQNCVSWGTPYQVDEVAPPVCPFVVIAGRSWRALGAFRGQLALKENCTCEIISDSGAEFLCNTIDVVG